LNRDELFPSAERATDGGRPASYYRVAGLDLREEMKRLCRLPAFGGSSGPLVRRPPSLTVRRASKRPRSRLGFAVLEEWRISVTAYAGQTQGDAKETLLHELVHLFIGVSSGTRRWHGREFKITMRRAMREAYDLRGVKVNGTYHGAYAAALERRRSREAGKSNSLHPGQLALIEAA
jgi:SprT-like family